ncbi:type ISP restriction/modification enzyme [uncultured Roseibium sp.]|uniref:type ISP restriction/modification enzyme n=1 Tax=uncultured Roseibium sp. TaxID=1936171 RepID=UPI002631B835|nr:type ISP restriction/modification enzyme [uncultured Roseibium sp.]
MSIDIAAFVSELQRLTATGQTTEHSFRPALAGLLDSLADDVHCINEPTAIVNVGRPDFVLERANGQKAAITVGHVEAKDIDLDIKPKAMRDANKAQFERYVKALPNLIYTNGLDFAFYRNGELVREISIGDWMMGVQPKPENYEALTNQLRDFAAERLQTITSAERLAEMMAGKAVLAKDVLFKTLREDKDLNSELAEQYKAFKDQLIHDLEVEEFADIYAETIAYGMFAARLHDETLEDFTREEALRLLPKTNPFLRKLFEYVAGTSLSEPVRRTIDELAEIFQATDLQKLFENFGAFTQRNDPFIHFYETFLAKYNPAKRKARGVWYTPEPVVNFIVRAVDDVLKTEFGLSDGLADTSKITIDWDTGQRKMNKDGTLAKSGANLIEKRQVHRVQILDPAAGTGTFLAEVIRQIGERVRGIAPGQWSSYVENEMIPRLHGFELLMASYAMCHMKLDMMLTKMGYKPTGATPPRLGVYLTNSLEEGEKVNQTLPFAQWLSNEAKQANTVKNDVPVMCVIGNPPYLGEGGKSEGWIGHLMDDYKKEPGGKQKLQERNPKWLNDLYVKFIRMSSHLIEKNGEGVLGFITNHGYLDNPTFRGMRWHLLNTFDRIWVLDLHGNAKKKEVSPDGSPDKNVFDIQQGVAIIIAVKKKRDGKAEKPLAQMMHGDLWGSRREKNEALIGGRPESLSAVKLPNKAPQYPFVMRDFGLETVYLTGFSVNQLMYQNGNGIVTKRDRLCVQPDRPSVETVLNDFEKLSEVELRKKYSLPADVRDWRYEWAKADVLNNRKTADIAEINYRPFDVRHIYYSGKARGLVGWPVKQVMRHYLQGCNIGLLTSKALRDANFAHALVTERPTEAILLSGTTGSNAMNFPLYLYPTETELDQSRRVNMDLAIRRRIEAAAMGQTISPLAGEMSSQMTEGGAASDTEPGSIPPSALSNISPTRGEIDDGEIAPVYDTDGRPNEVAIFDYIYGVLHCPAYRETYKEFLKIDFPRVPYPPSPEVFRDVQAKGTELRRLHLMEDAAVGETPYPFTGEGDPVVGKVAYENGAVLINDTHRFENVPSIAWEFYIGGYQPAQKWLKDRKGRTLSFEDIKHYRKIIKILTETDRIMQTITMDLSRMNRQG